MATLSRRAIERMLESEKQTDEYVRRVWEIYNQANRNINREIEKIYAKYASKTGLDTQTLRELLSKHETDKFWQTLEGQGLKDYVRNNYKARISRYEQVQGQVYAKAKAIAPLETIAVQRASKQALVGSFNRIIYDHQMVSGYKFSFNKLDDRLTNTIINDRWSGKLYSERIWGNTDILAERVSKIVGGGLISGTSREKMAREIREQFGVGKYYAERLVRTECAYFHNQAELEAYKEMGVEWYQYRAVLDGKTSQICRDLDSGEPIRVSEAEVGKNFPPMHPNCRSTTQAWFGEEFAPLRRRAMNPATGETEMIPQMSYEVWDKLKDGIVSYAKSNNAGEFEAGTDKRITTEKLEQIRNQLNERGIDIDTKSFEGLSESLIVKNIEKLNEYLDENPEIAEMFKGKMDIQARTLDKGDFAATAFRPEKGHISLWFSKDAFASEKGLITKIAKLIKNGEYSKVLPSEYVTNVVTHEFGHVIENYLFSRYNIANPERWDTELGKYLKGDRIAYGRYREAVMSNIKIEIIELAKESNPKFNWVTESAIYGHQNSSEFFAEAYTNYRGGLPNELGVAMGKYLKLKGLR